MDARNIKQLNKEIELTRSIQLLAKTYEELAVMKMQRIRGSVESTRRFTDDLLRIYSEVKYSYKKDILNSAHNGVNSDDEKRFSFSTMNKNGKRLCVLVTPNQRFSGNIAKKVFYPFYDYITRLSDTDVIVIGKVGREMLEQAGYGKKFVYLNLDNQNNYENLRQVFGYMLKYQSIDVFHGKFNNLVDQVAVKENLSGDELEVADYDALKSEEYLFEPSADRILTFFEEQIFGTLFKQSLAEARLARLGSRISAMEVATNNAGQRVKKLAKDRVAMVKSIENKKQLQRISGIYIWG